MAVANQTVSQTVESGAPVAAAAVSSADDAARFSSSSLYVGDLNPDATEQDLLEVFGAIGPISSIRLLRDAVTRRSLQYAYVNFQSAADADRALEALNFSELKGRPMRVMWLQRDPSMRRSGLGNIFVKNLAKDIDNKSLYDTFSPFGNILSCKVAMASDGKSKGYGYVHFETQEAADAAIATVNKMMLAGTRVEVMRFVPRRERSGSDGEPKFNNVYVKNFPETWTEDDLAKIFEPHGDILSVFVRRDEGTGSSKGFGFVTFGTPEAAKSAVDALNGAEIAPGKQVFVGRAQKKTERMSVLRRKFEQLKMERMTKYQGVNLYIKNLDDNATDDMLRKAFEEFGNITSAKVMYDERGISRGFGFVCFTTPEEATRAVTQMNGRMLGSKPLYVAIAQKREFRQAQLAAQYAQRNMMAASAAAAAAAAAAMQYGQMAPPPGAPGSQAPAPNGAPGGRGMPPPGMFFPPGVVPPQGQQFMYPPPGGMRRWNGPQNAQPGYPGVQFGLPMSRGGRRGGSMRGGMPGKPYPGARGGAPGGPGPRTGPGPMRGGQRMEGVPMTMPVSIPPTAPGAAPAAGASAPLDLSLVSHMEPSEAKRYLGEFLFRSVQALYPQNPAKVTGMLIELDVSELINLFESPAELKSAVDEAAAMLAEHYAADNKQ